ncbi:MAG: penicillin-binding protein 2 [Gammaproteobacteria bacterium]|nr:penicillin-binding protein 2 [Gammaproteobacteria bacterium]
MSRPKPTHVYTGRRVWVLCLLGGAALLLMWRVVDIQVFNKAFLQVQGEARHLRVVSLPVHRGVISDRNGEPLAISTPVDSVWVNPQELAGARAEWPRLAKLLDFSVKELAQFLDARMEREFVYLKRRVTPGLAGQVMALKLPGVALQREYRRYYPSGEVTAHVVGFTGVEDNGQEGLELAYDAWLRGTPGSKRVMRDRLGRIVQDVEQLSAPQPGRDIQLSLDRRIQYLAYRELKSAVLEHHALSGSAVILDVQTGEVLAMVNVPAYNPNSPGETQGARLRNRALTDVFEPGSTIKPFTIAAALETGQYRPDTPIDTAPGAFRVGHKLIRDMHDYGRIDVSTVIQKSSNVGASKIALTIPPERLWRMFSSVGLGTLSGSGFPGEASGRLSSPRKWGEIERATLSFGYGLSVTALQLAQAYTALANDGELRPVSLLRVDNPLPGKRVMQPGTATAVRAMMERVVADGGTGTQARIPGYRVAGKTGTVHKIGAEGYDANRYLSLFAGMAPATRPRLVMAVIINEPQGDEYYGGLVAAPVFAKVMTGALRLLDVSPDDLPSLQIAQSNTVRREELGVRRNSSSPLTPHPSPAEGPDMGKHE